ncbi:hypothetical protein H6P81_021181 [Aristolochia fimbriata]|uniref:Uncharacterized protein n=1 Tax=Aristolochia fimbriata TaxID=158543 RepID=A0AAV7DRK6_ARIFI|nr:hypothetical protein H6P81_021166 [Aristolochia fimbriata]KAG9438883.1 hypothetical protein H6P81_021181 [Aristolochia fimbriata]
MGGDHSREQRSRRITSAEPAWRAAGAAGKCLVGQQPSEPGGAQAASTRNWPRSALLKARTAEGGRTKDLWKSGLVPGEKIVLFPTETTDTLNGSSTRWAYLFRASFSWREQNNRERPGRPAQGSRASHTRVSRKASVSVLGLGPS